VNGANKQQVFYLFSILPATCTSFSAHPSRRSRAGGWHYSLSTKLEHTLQPLRDYHHHHLLLYASLLGSLPGLDCRTASQCQSAGRPPPGPPGYIQQRTTAAEMIAIPMPRNAIYKRTAAAVGRPVSTRKQQRPSLSISLCRRQRILQSHVYSPRLWHSVQSDTVNRSMNYPARRCYPQILAPLILPLSHRAKAPPLTSPPYRSWLFDALTESLSSRRRERTWEALY